MQVTFLVPGNILHNSGGNVFNARLAQGLRALGVEVDVVPVEGSWPEASAKDRRRLGGLLGAWTSRVKAPSGTVTLVDGLIACGAPAEIEYAAAAGQRTWVLLHMPSPSHPDGEKRALRAAAGVICTSSSAAAHVTDNYGLAGRVALPGTDAAPLAPGSEPPHIIAVAALLPNKDQCLIVAALARLKDLPWSASLVGTDDADPAYAALVRSAIAAQGLEGRVRMTGELAGKALADEWNRADLSLLVSRAESFGLVVTESLARGIPVIVRKGTGAVDALGLASSLSDAPGGDNGTQTAGAVNARAGDEGTPGADANAVSGSAAGQPDSAVAYRGTGGAQPDTAGARPDTAGALPGAAVELDGPERDRPDVLAAVIRQWLSDATLRSGWRSAAVAGRDRLPGWEVTALNVLEILRPSATTTATPAEEAPTAGGSSGAQ
ncbi:glycosyltransferase family 4 protein [Pseudarthrobacter sp. YS3]|uniref:glycosyltransferase family 4 protein n=1 Tax=Pseudarthrobacter sp. YS3 TaxID=3453718 RepID=UPI003EEB0706